MRKTEHQPQPRVRFNFMLFLSLLLLSLVGSERAYPLGCSQQPPSFYDYDNYPFPPSGLPLKSNKDYAIVSRLGTGKFSDVFEGVDMELERALKVDPGKLDLRTLVVLKCLKPVSERKIRRELLVLHHVRKLPNLVRLLGIVVPPKFYASNRESTDLPEMPTLILEHAGRNCRWLSHSQADGVVSLLTEYEIKYYLCHLLVALDSLHSIGIMHRDVKPRNVLINREEDADSLLPGHLKPLVLIDAGLADFYRPIQRYNVRVASRHYKGPELLLGYEYYGYSLDLWGVGCLLAGLLFRREPLFRGRDNVDQLSKVIEHLGTKDLLSYISRYKMKVQPEILDMIREHGETERQDWHDLYSCEDIPEPSSISINLLDKLLVYDHEARVTAQEALSHPFFDDVRERVLREVRRCGFE